MSAVEAMSSMRIKTCKKYFSRKCHIIRKIMHIFGIYFKTFYDKIINTEQGKVLGVKFYCYGMLNIAEGQPWSRFNTCIHCNIIIVV